jgi:hypothetical protein
MLRSARIVTAERLIPWSRMATTILFVAALGVLAVYHWACV